MAGLPHQHAPFFRYVRDSVDPTPSGAHWSSGRTSHADVGSFQLFAGYREGFEKIVYFCFKNIHPPYGAITTVYRMSEKPCTDGWRLQFHLYGSNGVRDGLSKLVIGRYDFLPHHSTVVYNNNALSFRSNFTVYALSVERSSSSSHRAPPNAAVTTCPSTPVRVYPPATISSPNYPNKYPPRSNCSWLVRQPPSGPHDNGLYRKLFFMVFLLKLKHLWTLDSHFNYNQWLTVIFLVGSGMHVDYADSVGCTKWSFLLGVRFSWRNVILYPRFQTNLSAQLDDVPCILSYTHCRRYVVCTLYLYLVYLP